MKLLDRLRSNLPLLAGENEYCRWQVLEAGVLSFTPMVLSARAVIISAGIHGNETAPIELLAKLCEAIMTGKLTLKVRLLVIFGNLPAMLTGVRYLEEDLNRLFASSVQSISGEAMRAKRLQALCADFIATQSPCYHYDLHTAIKPSLLPTFALLPYNTLSDSYLRECLRHAALDALVYHSTANTTFSCYTAALGAQSVTLELGAAKPFGENNLADFAPTEQMLVGVISQCFAGQASDTAIPFVVKHSLIKSSADFRFVIDKNAPNFLQIAKGALIAKDKHQDFVLDYPAYTLFLNESVKVGLRAGLFLQRLSAS